MDNTLCFHYEDLLMMNRDMKAVYFKNHTDNMVHTLTSSI